MAEKFKMPARPERFGKLFENDILGEIKKPPQLPIELFTEFKAGYLPYKEAMEIVKKMQPGDPENPNKDFPKELKIEIAEKLKIPDENVKFYTAIGSPLDIKHGVDAFFEIKLKDGSSRTVTLDVTLNPQKGDKYKADIIIKEIPDSQENEKEYLKKIEEVADEIVFAAEKDKKLEKAA